MGFVLILGPKATADQAEQFKMEIIIGHGGLLFRGVLL